MTKRNTKILKKDIVIPAGTIFYCVDGRKSDFVKGNYACLISLNDDTCGELIYGMDDGRYLDEWFDDVSED